MYGVYIYIVYIYMTCIYIHIYCKDLIFVIYFKLKFLGGVQSYALCRIFCFGFYDD